MPAIQPNLSIALSYWFTVQYDHIQGFCLNELALTICVGSVLDELIEHNLD